jgi:hypothetical protein
VCDAANASWRSARERQRPAIAALLDCRPILVPRLLAATGWHVQAVRPLTVAGLPVSATAATPATT